MAKEKFVWKKEEKMVYIKSIVSMSVLLWICYITFSVGIGLVISIWWVGLILMILGGAGTPFFVVGIVKKCKAMKMAKDQARQRYEEESAIGDKGMKEAVFEYPSDNALDVSDGIDE